MNFFSKFSWLIFDDKSKKIPKPIIIVPPIWLNPWIISPEEFVKALLMITPKVENTIENPRTKNNVFRIILVLFIVIVLEPPFWFISLRVDPEIYAKNAGIIGKIQGAKNEPKPNQVATKSVISATF